MRFYVIRGTSNYCAQIGFGFRLVLEHPGTGTIGQTPAYTSLKIF